MLPDNIEYRVEQLESKICDVGTDVKLIMRNHLPHVQVEIAKIGTKMDDQSKLMAWGGGIISAVIITLLGFVLSSLS